MLRRLLPLLCALCLSACSQPDLPHTIVRAGTEDELASTRAELVARFGAAPLADYDVALQELQLAGMDRGLASAADRAAAMRTAVNGKSVRAVEILGWQARRTRLLAEIKEFAAMLDHDLALRDKTSATGTPQTVTHRIENEQDILAKLRRLLAETEAKLAAWNAAEKPPV